MKLKNIKVDKIIGLTEAFSTSEPEPNHGKYKNTNVWMKRRVMNMFTRSRMTHKTAYEFMTWSIKYYEI